MSAGLRLGRDDIEGQCRYLEKTAEELEVRLLEARKEKESRSRLYKTLGLTAGCSRRYSRFLKERQEGVIHWILM